MSNRGKRGNFKMLSVNFQKTVRYVTAALALASSISQLSQKYSWKQKYEMILQLSVELNKTPIGSCGACALERHGPFIAIMHHHTALCDWCSAVATGRGALSAQTLPIESMKSCVAQAHNRTNSLCYNFDELLTVYQRRSEAGSEMELMLIFGNFARPAAHRWKIDNTKR